MPRFSVEQYMQKCKQAREESFRMKRKLELAQTELSQLENELHEKKKLLCALKERKRRMESKVSGYIHAYLFSPSFLWTGITNAYRIRISRAVNIQRYPLFLLLYFPISTRSNCTWSARSFTKVFRYLYFLTIDLYLVYVSWVFN